MAALQTDYRFTFATQGGKQLDVIGFTLLESLSEPFTLSLSLSSAREKPVQFAEVLDQGGTLTCWLGQEAVRYSHGIVSQFKQNGTGFRRTHYEATLVPSYARMALSSHCRIFQNLSAPEILAQVLTENEISDYQFVLSGQFVAREYCVQYRETDQDFIERLAAEEGLHYYFKHADGQHTLVFSDLSQKAPDLGEIYYNGSRGGAATEPSLWGFAYEEKLATTEHQLRDYNFETPGVTLEQNAVKSSGGAAQKSYRKYDYPGRYKSDAVGKVFNQLRLEYEQRDTEVAGLTGDVMLLTPGHQLKLSAAAQPAVGQQWVITAIRHQGFQPQSQLEEAGSGGSGYTGQLSLIPHNHPWRPTPGPRPMVDGPQIAHIVGPEGEEIYCDEHGRVKVQFPWDLEGEHNEHASCWIRVSQGWAGTGWGAMAIPRIGQEVIVDFLEGDPDQPIITGRTYHSANVPPYDLPANKTRMSIKSQTHKGTGFNELRFEDEAGQEEVFIHAQKDQNNVVLNDESTEVGHNRSEHVGNNESTTIDGNQVETIKKSQAETVFIAKALSVGAGYQVSVGASKNETVGISSTEEVGVLRKTLVGKRFEVVCGASKLILNADGTIILEGSKITLNGADQVEINGKMVDVN